MKNMGVEISIHAYVDILGELPWLRMKKPNSNIAYKVLKVELGITTSLALITSHRLIKIMVSR
jgi:hypothetical protein